MNVYDFDKTIIHPDSSFSFFCYCARHYTLAVSKCVTSAVVQFVRYLAHGKSDAQQLKEALFSFLNRIDNIDFAVQKFWEKHAGQIAPWYLAQKKDDDIIISASPEFLLRPIVQKLGVTLIATCMNPYTGKITGKNCHDHEKARRFLELYPDSSVDEFYSDSLCDEPMAKLAGKSYLVRENERIPWPAEKERSGFMKLKAIPNRKDG